MTTVSPREAYRILADEYDSQPNALVSLEQRMMAQVMPPIAGRIAVDCGAGTGRWGAYCEEHGAKTLALDSCPEMLARCRQKAILADMRQIPLRDGYADLTICAFAYGYSPTCLRELARITRRGGTLLMSDVHPEAIRSGWTRSFRHRSGVVRIADEPYRLEDLHVRGLELDCLIEPKFGEPEKAIFERAGHGQRFAEASARPAIFVARWLKT